MSLLFIPLPLPNSATNTSTITGGIISSSTATEITSQAFSLNDNIITINQGEVGPGVTKTQTAGGFEIYRGPQEPKYQVLFDEASSGLLAGFNNQPLEKVALIDASLTDGSIPAWNGVNLTSYSGLSSSQATILRAINQNLSSTSWPTFTSLNLSTNEISFGGQVYHFPNATTIAGNVLTNDGYGNLSWTPGGGNSSSSNNITSTGGEVSANCTNLGLNVSFSGQGAPKLQILTDKTIINNTLKVTGGISGSTKTIITNTYAVIDSDYLLKWSNIGNCDVTLPQASINDGRMLILINKSSAGTITITPTSGDLLSGDSQPLILSNVDDNIELICDGENNWLIL